MVETVTYWIRFNCAWRKVTTSLAQWAKLPHVVGSCKVVPALLTVLLLGPVTPAGVVPEDGRFTGGFEKLTSEETAIPSLEPSFSWPSGSGTAPGIGTASAAGAASEGGPDANDMNDMLVTDWSCVLPDPAIAVPEAAPDTPTNRAMCC